MHVLISSTSHGRINIRHLGTEDIAKLLADPDAYGVDKFHSQWPLDPAGNPMDPAVWKTGDALLAKVSVLHPKPVTTKYVL